MNEETSLKKMYLQLYTNALANRRGWKTIDYIQCQNDGKPQMLKVTFCANSRYDYVENEFFIPAYEIGMTVVCHNVVQSWGIKQTSFIDHNQLMNDKTSCTNITNTTKEPKKSKQESKEDNKMNLETTHEKQLQETKENFKDMIRKLQTYHEYE